MITLHLDTEMAFLDVEAVTAFVQSLPLSPKEKDELIRGDEITDNDDRSDFPGVQSLVHKFRITES